MPNFNNANNVLRDKMLIIGQVYAIAALHTPEHVTNCTWTCVISLLIGEQ